ncbi:MAG TPA: pre-peptidase C-terminal domain-containing protein, partial [Isosphaeraceae bacterium]
MSRLLPLCAGLLAPAAAVAASPTIESVVPAVGQAGKEFVVVLAGARLKEAREVVFYGTGLECSKLVAASENEVRATLRASADCPIGPHPFRVRTPGGLSELKVVHVSPLPVVAEVETNDAPRSAQAIAPNTTVAGVIDSGDVDVFAVALRKGDRLSAEVQAVRLGGEMTDAILTILGPRGEALATADDGPITRQDPAASIVAPADGTYTILIRETSFGGRPTSTYALHVGDFPRPSAVFPPGARSGRRARLRLLGAPEPAIADVDVPGIAGPWWDYYPRLAGGPSPTPVPIRVRPYDGFDEPDLTEVGPPPASGVEAREWPVAFHGVIAGPGDVDAFAIKARAGDRVRVEVFAARLGSPLDTVVEVLDGDGDLVARNDDDASHDSRLIFKAPADGTYRIVVADKRREGGRGFVYRVEVEEPRP